MKRSVDMTPSEARATLLAAHSRLRALLGAALAIARRFVAGTVDISELEGQLGGLRRAFAEHNQSELALLEPYLLRGPEWGPERVARMRKEHEAEELVLDRFLARPAAELALALAEFAEMLSEHLAVEERSFLRPDVFDKP